MMFKTGLGIGITERKQLQPPGKQLRAFQAPASSSHPSLCHCHALSPAFPLFILSPLLPNKSEPDHQLATMSGKLSQDLRHTSCLTCHLSQAALDMTDTSPSSPTRAVCTKSVCNIYSLSIACLESNSGRICVQGDHSSQHHLCGCTRKGLRRSHLAEEGPSTL